MSVSVYILYNVLTIAPNPKFTFATPTNIATNNYIIAYHNWHKTVTLEYTLMYISPLGNYM